MAKCVLLRLSFTQGRLNPILVLVGLNWNKEKLKYGDVTLPSTDIQVFRIAFRDLKAVLDHSPFEEQQQRCINA